jgi:sulfate-transporting ATPase
VIYSLVFNNGTLTGGFVGTVVGSPHVAGINIDPIGHPDRYGIFVLVMLVLVGLIVANVRRGRTGRRLIAVRANERAAASIGVGVYGAKLYAFALSAAIAGIAGVCIAFMNPNVEFVNFDVFGSLNGVVYAVIGGLGWASGSIIGAQNAPGALPAKALDSLFSSTSIANFLLIFSGAMTFVILRSAPDGVAAMQSRQWQAVTGRFFRSRQGSPRPAVSEHVTPLRDRVPATLSVSGVTVRFGGVVALNDVSFEVAPGHIVGLIGPNGAGKTTLLDVVTGFTSPQEGSVLLDGEPIDALGPEGRARRGMARSWQGVELFEELTVRENLLVAADAQNMSPYLTDLVRPGRLTHSQAVNDVIAEFELERHLDQRPSELPQGTGRLVGIGRAIAIEPRVLLLDEPAAGLDSGESRELGHAIRAMVARTGIGALVVEHDVNLLLDICDRIVVLDFGRKIAEGVPDAVANDPAVIAAYLGVADDELAAMKTVEPA